MYDSGKNMRRLAIGATIGLAAIVGAVNLDRAERLNPFARGDSAEAVRYVKGYNDKRQQFLDSLIEDQPHLKGKVDLRYDEPFSEKSSRAIDRFMDEYTADFVSKLDFETEEGRKATVEKLVLAFGHLGSYMGFYYSGRDGKVLEPGELRRRIEATVSSGPERVKRDIRGGLRGYYFDNHILNFEDKAVCVLESSPDNVPKIVVYVKSNAFSRNPNTPPDRSYFIGVVQDSIQRFTALDNGINGRSQ